MSTFITVAGVSLVVAGVIMFVYGQLGIRKCDKQQMALRLLVKQSGLTWEDAKDKTIDELRVMAKARGHVTTP